MSFKKIKTKVEEGDTVILYITVHQVYSVTAIDKTVSKKGSLIENIFQTPYGALKCSDLIGKEYGSKINLSKGWGYILQPTPELWTQTLPHRTQIIYTPDASMIVFQLEIKPGSIIVECGTGSGSLSHALIRNIKPHGHLYTFDFHEQRVKTANEEFQTHGLGDWVTIKQRDVCNDGFGEEVENKADAVFLDLPHPWLAIPHTLKTLKSVGGRLCSFSPCIEQVQKTCSTLLKLGFQEIQTMEVLQTEYTVITKSLNILNLSYLRNKKSDSDTEKQEKDVIKVVTSIPPSTQPGHTGYLTFATLPPIWARRVYNETFDENSIDIEEDT